jgi:hypothetical protein
MLLLASLVCVNQDESVLLPLGNDERTAGHPRGPPDRLSRLLRQESDSPELHVVTTLARFCGPAMACRSVEHAVPINMNVERSRSLVKVVCANASAQRASSGMFVCTQARQD